MIISSVDTDLESLFNTYFKRLVYFSYQIVANKETAEDTVQEVFLKYYRNKKEVDAEVNDLISYLYSSVRNASLNFLRHQKVESKYKEQLAVSEVDEDYIMASITRAEVIAELYAALETLPEGCKKISYLSFIQEKKNQEIAQELGISVTTVKSQKQRSLQLLRLRLNPEIFGAILLILLSE
ncbi:DNA-directed RNA polymerase sigma-70 factor [Adhaeribacter aerolatus]|uniref:DNA-directed RNA polymerase sigma-70 factor n=1 Tax=Adhaeribacter aerolatus TaxID=670289 RepID=A0A512B2S6_9BACT|nr:RNA polymerase sigma-70 factor [Adhaeribacter aerolatus]GEO06260.1 DNA-directed RNA polymerase sigma-70 factor [Adhaeribacter aerolatus]